MTNSHQVEFDNGYAEGFDAGHAKALEDCAVAVLHAREARRLAIIIPCECEPCVQLRRAVADGFNQFLAARQ